jgi:branched-chain amino acid aminotransferase
MRKITVAAIVGAVVAAVSVSPAAARQHTPPDDNPRFALLEMGAQLAPKAPLTTAGKAVAPAGANPYLALVPDPATIDYSGWARYVDAKGEQRAAQRPAPSSPILVDEDEPVGSSGSNDTLDTAQRVDGFGTGRRQNARLTILGTSSPPAVVAEPVDANAEDDGSIPLAGETGIGLDRDGITTSAVIGDGPHGSAGSGSGDFDFYAVDVVAGEQLIVDIDTPPGGDLDSIVVLFDANGNFVPETEVVIPFRDRSFNRGDGCFDMTRTFDGRIFRLEEHVERLYRSLRYLRIDIGLEPKEVVAISEEVVQRNEPLRAAAGDWWLAQRVSRGVDAIGDEGWANTGPQVIVDCTPLPLSARAPQFRDGIDVVIPSIRRIPPPMLSPRAKTHNYLNLILADKEVKSAQPQAWSVLLDENGNLCEGIGSNIFVVRDERIYTPREKYVLPGVSRRTAMELAAQLGLTAEERDLDVYDAVTADEVFLTSTSLCICPVRSVNGQVIGDGRVPGPVTKRITQAYVDYVGTDFVAQYLSRLA